MLFGGMCETVHIRKVSKLLQGNAVELTSDKRFVNADATVCNCHSVHMFLMKSTNCLKVIYLSSSVIDF